LRWLRWTKSSVANDSRESDHLSDVSPRALGIRDEAAGLRTKLILRRVRQRYGLVPLSVRIRAHDPTLLALCEQMNCHTAAPGVIAPQLRELAQLKVAVMVGCPF
jgi:hypothetical protein